MWDKCLICDGDIIIKFDGYECSKDKNILSHFYYSQYHVHLSLKLENDRLATITYFHDIHRIYNLVIILFDNKKVVKYITMLWRDPLPTIEQIIDYTKKYNKLLILA